MINNGCGWRPAPEPKRPPTDAELAKEAAKKAEERAKLAAVANSVEARQRREFQEHQEAKAPRVVRGGGMYGRMFQRLQQAEAEAEAEAEAPAQRSGSPRRQASVAIANDLNSSDLYKVLGLTKAANEIQVKKHFRELAMQWHPDRNPGNDEAAAHFRKVPGCRIAGRLY